MSSQLKIEAFALPEKGKEFAGQIDSAIFDLSGNDVKPAAPLEYEIFAQCFGSELFVSGKISAAFEFICVRTLTPFLKTIRIDDFKASFEVEKNAEVDVSEMMREEIILAFPLYPRCDEGDNPTPCEINSSYLAVDKPAENDVNPAADSSPGIWSQLDDLQKKG